jgi:hypothetical protein
MSLITQRDWTEKRYVVSRSKIAKRLSIIKGDRSNPSGILELYTTLFDVTPI